MAVSEEPLLPFKLHLHRYVLFPRKACDRSGCVPFQVVAEIGRSMSFFFNLVEGDSRRCQLIADRGIHCLQSKTYRQKRESLDSLVYVVLPLPVTEIEVCCSLPVVPYTFPPIP